MNRISIILLSCSMLSLSSVKCMEVGVKERTASREDPRDKNYYWLHVYDDEAPTQMVHTNISLKAADYMGWLKRQGAASIGRRDKRLVVPISLSHWKRIQSCFKVNAHEDFSSQISMKNGIILLPCL